MPSFRSLLNAVAYVLKAKKLVIQPKKAKVLIFDRCGSQHFSLFFRESDMEILDVRGESINLYVLHLMSLVRKDFIHVLCAEVSLLCES